MAKLFLDVLQVPLSCAILLSLFSPHPPLCAAARQGQRRLHEAEQLRKGGQRRRCARWRLREGHGRSDAAAVREITEGVSAGH